MEKLLKLLNQFEKARVDAVNAKWLPYNIKLSFRPYTERDLTNEAYRSCWLEICSKYYKFIKWLVDNDKIDVDKLDFVLYDNNTTIYWGIDLKAYSTYETTLMNLSIQDNPIKFLISILK